MNCGFYTTFYMMHSIFEQMVSKYSIQTESDRLNAYHEVMQQIALSALHRANFFEKAAFYGGTCLRIFHRLPRFSEDMDFSLLKTEPGFTLEPYFDQIVTEFKAMGREVVLNRKKKQQFSQVESAFLKDNTEIVNLAFQTEKTVKIKIEVDIAPPPGFATEHRLLLLPYSFMTRCFTLPSLYAGKMHALLFRQWKTRVKGRDWYDFEWYVRNGVKLNFSHLRQRAYEKGIAPETEFTPEIFRKMLKDKIKSTDIRRVIQDVKPFVQDAASLDIWSTDFFMQLVDMIEFE